MEQLTKILVTKLYQIVSLHINSERETIRFCDAQLHFLYKLRDYHAYTYEDFVVIWIYLDRLSVIPTHLYLTPRNKSYVLLTLHILYSKMYNERWYCNSYYANWTRTNLTLLNQIEVNILKQINLVINHDEFTGVLAQLT